MLATPSDEISNQFLLESLNLQQQPLCIIIKKVNFKIIELYKMPSENFLFVGFENLNIKNSYSWFDYRLKFNLIDFNVIFLNLTKWHYKFNEFETIRSDIRNVLEAGSTVFIIFKLATGIVKSQYGEKRKCSNLAILPFLGIIKNFSEDNGVFKKVIKSPYKRYFEHLKNWNWYFSEYFNDKNWYQCEIIPLAVNGINKPIGFILETLEYMDSEQIGSSIFLPEIKNIELGIKQLLEDIYQKKIFEKSPSWVKNIKTVEELKFENKRNEFREYIKKKAITLKKVNKKINNEKLIKKILYEDGTELEDSIKNLFDSLSIKYHEEKIDEEDCFIESNFGNFLFEIKGSESVFNKKGLRQLIDWEDSLEKMGYKIDRCIFIGNHYRFDNIKERKYPFENNLLKFAERNNFLIILTTDLFDIYNDYQSKKISLKDIYKIFKNSPTKFNYKKYFKSKKIL